MAGVGDAGVVGLLGSPGCYIPCGGGFWWSPSLHFYSIPECIFLELSTCSSHAGVSLVHVDFNPWLPT